MHDCRITLQACGTTKWNKFTCIFIVILRSTSNLQRSRNLANSKRDRQVENKLTKNANGNIKYSEINNTEIFLK